MKKLTVAILFLFIAVATNAQTYVFESFDKSVANGWWDLANLYSNQGSATAKWDVTDVTTDKKEGTGAAKINYVIGAGDSWGGYIVRTSVKPLPYFTDLSAGKTFSFWYKVTKPVVTTQAGTVLMEFKISDVQDGKEDRFYREMPIDLADASGQWKQVTVDLKIGTDKTKEWAPQAQEGDGELQLDKINKFELALVYITTGTGVNTPTASGEVMIDAASISGDNYAPPLFTFNKQSSIFKSTWASGTGKATLTDEATDKPEGTLGSMKIDYTCDASEDWGGVMGFETPVTPPVKIEERTALTLFIKNVKAVTTTVPKRAVLRIYIMEKSDGTNQEEWVTKVPIDLTKLSDWTRYLLPLKQGVNGKIGDNESDQYPPVGTFALNPNGPKGDKTFNPEKMTNFKVEVLAVGAGGTDSGPKGEKLVGTLLFSMMQQSGFQSADKTPPVAPKPTVTKATNSNLVTWADVAGETNEKYNVYFSLKPITNVDGAGVSALALNVGENVQVWEHLLRAPKTDKDQTYYYAITCVDKAGNVSPIGVAGPITNKAKGIPTIAMVTPNFKADGKLDEWTAVTPFELSPTKGTATIVKNFTVTNDADCSAKVYVAIDQTYLYIAYDVTDDIVYDNADYYTSGNSWALDATDLEWGFYNLNTTKIHTAYQRGSSPDYHIRFNKQRARSDHWTSEKDSLLLPGANYWWAEKFPSGYIVEAKVKLSDLATLRKDPKATKDTITVVKGAKIPFDLVINDNDGKNGSDKGQNREGMISWGPFNQDGGWQYPNQLMYTWIGDEEIVGIEDQNELPAAYSLSQNYPNPFNPTTQIKYTLSKAGMVNLKVYDVLGRQVTELVNKYQEVGTHVIGFNASQLSSGVYFYRIESGSFTDVKKMLLVK